MAKGDVGTSKLEQRRALGLRKYEDQQGKIAAAKPKPQKIKEAKQAVESITTQTQISTQPTAKVTTKKRGVPANHTPSGKVAEWRINNKDHYNEYMRNYRAKKKANAAP